MDNCRSPDNDEADPALAEHGLSDLFQLLADRRRRYALYCLDNYETPMALADLTDEIVRLETDTEPTTVPDIRDQVYIHLYHRHLPKLAAAGVITFDMNANVVSPGPNADTVKPYLKQLVDEWPPGTKTQTDE